MKVLIISLITHIPIIYKGSNILMNFHPGKYCSYFLLKCLVYLQVNTNIDCFPFCNTKCSLLCTLFCFLFNLIRLRDLFISVHEKLLYSFFQLHSTPCYKCTILFNQSLLVDLGLSPAFCYWIAVMNNLYIYHVRLCGA